jgi:hypothetical protein
MTHLTRTQQKALHVGFKLIAEALNGSGLDMKAVLKPHIDIPWTDKSVKEYLFKPVMHLAVQKESTTELEKVGEIERVWDIVMRFLGENHGIEYIDFPHDPDKQAMNERGYKLAAHEASKHEDYPDPDYIEVRGF